MSHPLERYWNNLTDETRTALSLAHRHSKNQGSSGRLRTRYVVASLLTLKPESLEPLLAGIPGDALPDPIPVDPDLKTEPLNDVKPDLSPCVRESLNALGQSSSPSSPVSPLDLFVDLAKHGRGSTVSTLRRHGITPETIDDLLKKYNRTPLER